MSNDLLVLRALVLDPHVAGVGDLHQVADLAVEDVDAGNAGAADPPLVADVDAPGGLGLQVRGLPSRSLSPSFFLEQSPATDSRSADGGWFGRPKR